MGGTVRQPHGIPSRLQKGMGAQHGGSYQRFSVDTSRHPSTHPRQVCQGESRSRVKQIGLKQSSPKGGSVAYHCSLVDYY
jgi:hypothetical protein